MTKWSFPAKQAPMAPPCKAHNVAGSCGTCLMVESVARVSSWRLR